MAPTLVLLGLLAALVVIASLLRRRLGTTRSIFQPHEIGAGRLTEGLLHALISDRGYLRADTRISGSFGASVAIDRDGACGRLVLYPVPAFGRDGDLSVLEALTAHHRSDPATTIVVVGGSQAFGREAFKATTPLRTLHVDDDGQVRETRAGFRSSAPRLVVERALARMAADLRDGAFPAIEMETARSLVSSPREDDPRGASPAFRGVVTSALTTAIILCFLVEVAISRDSIQGEGAGLAVVYRMGGIHRPAILAGEWQRLIAAPFLHFGVLHLVMNGWAQWTLGGPIEFLVGPWPFLLLWVVSGLGASLTSFFFNESSVSAGASGAIFGLLGAFTTFVFFRKDVLPQPVPKSLRNGVLATLLLNLMISFIPGIDMAAHAGGFLAGAILAFGAVRREDRTQPARATSGLLRLAVGLMVLSGVGITSFQERADLTVKAPEVQTEHAVGELRLPIPAGFSVSQTREKGLTIVEADRGPGSPFSVTFKVSDPQTDEASARRVLPSLRPESRPAAKDSGWIAYSQLGTQDLRALEIVVIAPSSCRSEAERLGSELAKRIH